jgi:hypothetical protein
MRSLSSLRKLVRATREKGMAAKVKYSAITRQISVTVSPTYLDDQSVPENSHFVWAYHIVIENRGSETQKGWSGSRRDI